MKCHAIATSQAKPCSLVAEAPEEPWKKFNSLKKCFPPLFGGMQVIALCNSLASVQCAAAVQQYPCAKGDARRVRHDWTPLGPGAPASSHHLTRGLREKVHCLPGGMLPTSPFHPAAWLPCSGASARGKNPMGSSKTLLGVAAFSPAAAPMQPTSPARRACCLTPPGAPVIGPTMSTAMASKEWWCHQGAPTLSKLVRGVLLQSC